MVPHSLVAESFSRWLILNVPRSLSFGLSPLIALMRATTATLSLNFTSYIGVSRIAMNHSFTARTAILPETLHFRIFTFFKNFPSLRPASLINRLLNLFSNRNRTRERSSRVRNRVEERVDGIGKEEEGWKSTPNFYSGPFGATTSVETSFSVGPQIPGRKYAYDYGVPDYQFVIPCLLFEHAEPPPPVSSVS